MLARTISFVTAVLAIASVTSAQEPVFVEVQSHPLGVTGAKADSDATRNAGGTQRAAPIVMQTSAHVHSDGSISTFCTAVPSAVPHAMTASRSVVKLQER